MNPFAPETLKVISVAHGGYAKMNRAELLTVDEHNAIKILQGIDVVGILLDNVALYKQVMKSLQIRLATIADQVPCIGLDVCHDGINCVHCLAKSDVQIKVNGAPPINEKPIIQKG